MVKLMYWSQKYTRHNARLTPEEEQRFGKAILKKYGKIHGNISKAMKEAVMQWIKTIEDGTDEH